MAFINPKIDFAFKRIFGSPESESILISFLNAVLYDGEDTIKEVEILNPYLAGEVAKMKDTYLDIHARLANESYVIIEMQMVNVQAFLKRILYNAAKRYVPELEKGDPYTDLKPVIALTIANFVLFQDTAAHKSHYHMTERDTLKLYPDNDIQLIFIELPKFDKSLSESIHLEDKWLYFLREADRLQEIPNVMATIAPIVRAFELADQATLSIEEKIALEKRERYVHEWDAGIQLALEKGIEQGHDNAMRKMTIHLLEMNLSDTAIVTMTELSLDEVIAIREAWEAK